MASTANGFQFGTGAGSFDLNMIDSSQDVTNFSAGPELIDMNIGQNDIDIHGGQDIIDFDTFFQIMKEEPGSESASKTSKGCMNIDTEVSAPMPPSDSVSPYSQQINDVNLDGHGSSSGESSWQEPPHGASPSDSSDAVGYNDSIDSHHSDFSHGMRTCFSDNNIQSSLGNLPVSDHKGHIGSSSSISNVNCSWPRNDLNNPDVIELDSSDDDVEVYGNHIANPYMSNVVKHGDQRVLPDTLNIQISGGEDSGRKIPSWAQQSNSKGVEKDFNGAIQAFPNKDGQMWDPLNLSVSYEYAGSAGVLHGNGSARDTGKWDSNYTSNSSAYLSTQGDFQNLNTKDKQTWNDVPMLGNGASIPRLQNILLVPPELSASESNSRPRMDIYEYEYGIHGEQEPKLSNCENLSLSSVTETNAWNAGLRFDVNLLTDNRRHLPPPFDKVMPPNIIHPHGLLPRHEVRTYQAALMDLDQPTTEMSPDEDLLAVPLLKHQRIGLGWMVEKEKKSNICTGGILADDQGLGKTITTISLILKEQPPSKSHQADLQNFKAQLCAVDLEEDDVDDLCGEPKPVLTAHNANVKKTVAEEDSMPSRKKGRPSAGTLVICPTSVLRQWAQEIHDKVTQKADLQLLVYHGSNRIKDPEEVAKYDIVLTTYSIVSLEVPKQDDDEQDDADDAGLCDYFTKKPKKKTSESKKKKNKNAKSGSSNDPGPGPLAKVNWFRVVLDEAQTIKNHRTQVSRACWSLRAKRRWCLSGTPIQNSIDDLYSYFRFLRCHTFDSYKNFCQKIKLPVSRNPNTGYKALQALLKTVMLRRTKASRIDGEPIIKLPTKTVDLMKIDFSEEEREFYSKLEADSRAQFKVYAAEGTVKKNYVNILLMLLRLRQACDHPLLVRNSCSRNWISSLKAVRNLPREKQIDLVQHLEGSVALCGICNDATEDALISLCYHIFCHQCIADHLAQREDTSCPSPNCKNHLKAELVFSLNALRHCITYDEKEDVRVPREDDEFYSKFEFRDFGSSKIKAAIQTLETISKARTGVNSRSAAVGESDVSSEAGFQDISEPCSKKLVMEKAEKAIVFSQWTSMLDLLESSLKKSRIQYRRLDGTMTVCARDKAVNDFKTLPQVTVMIMSLKAASLGLNLVAACHVIMLDLWWNPTTEDQAIDRAHRIGQTRPVHVSRFTVRDTVEDRILELQEKKREMVASAFGEDDGGRRSSRLTEEDLHYLFRM